MGARVETRMGSGGGQRERKHAKECGRQPPRTDFVFPQKALGAGKSNQAVP